MSLSLLILRRSLSSSLRIPALMSIRSLVAADEAEDEVRQPPPLLPPPLRPLSTTGTSPRRSLPPLFPPLPPVPPPSDTDR